MLLDLIIFFVNQCRNIRHIRIIFQKRFKWNFPFSNNDIIHFISGDDICKIIAHLRAAQKDFSFGTQRFNFSRYLQCLGNIPYITTKSHHFKIFTKMSDFIKGFFDGKFLPVKSIVRFVKLEQQPYSQICMDIFCIEGSKEHLHNIANM